jgi:hypothetical protein
MSSRFGITWNLPAGRRSGRRGMPRRAARPRPPGGTAPKRPEFALGSSQFESLDDVVVEADVADPSRSEGRLGHGVEGGIDGEAVVVRGHLDLAGRAVHHRLVDAAVAVLELVGAEAQRPAEDLVSEADAEVGIPSPRKAFNNSTSWSAVAGSPGPLEKKTRRDGPRGPAQRSPSRAARAPRCLAEPSVPASSP